MKQLLLILPVLLLLSSCQSAGQKQAAPVFDNPADLPVVSESVPESSEQTEYQALVEEEPEEPETPDYWFNHDFSLVYVQHKYSNLTTPVPALDETYWITRLGDRFYIQYKLKGVIQKTSVYEATPEGYHETIYKKGKVSWEHAFDNQPLDSEIRYLLRKKYPVAVDFPEGIDLNQAREGSCCGRPCWIAEVLEKTEGGQSTTTYLIDKEYGFFYRATEVGTNIGGLPINMTPFEVTSFTDQPTAKDIPNHTETNNPADQLKDQLQGILDSVQ